MKKFLSVTLVLLFIMGGSFYGGHKLGYNHAIYYADAILLENGAPVQTVFWFNYGMLQDKDKILTHIYDQFRIWFDWNLEEVEESEELTINL